MPVDRKRMFRVTGMIYLKSTRLLRFVILPLTVLFFYNRLCVRYRKHDDCPKNSQLNKTL